MHPIYTLVLGLPSSSIAVLPPLHLPRRGAKASIAGRLRRGGECWRIEVALTGLLPARRCEFVHDSLEGFLYRSAPR